MMASEHYVIIGNGPAANQAAITIKERAHNIRLTMIGREQEGYYRPDLIPGFVAGKIKEEDLYVHPTSFYSEMGVKLRLGQEVVNVDFQNRLVRLDHKELIQFDGLIIATGGKPRIPEPLHSYKECLLTLKTIADAKKWKEVLAEIDTILIIGGDLTSLSFTNMLLSMGKRIRFVVDGDCFWPLRFTNSICEDVVSRLEKRGIKVLESTKVKSLTRLSETCVEVETETSTEKVGVVGAFFGIVPEVSFLAGSGLHIERGILVDEYLRTPFRGVYAAGDCAQVYHPKLHDYWVSIGFQNAKNLGEVAAQNLLGAQVKAEAAPESIFKVEGISVNTSWWTEF